MLLSHAHDLPLKLGEDVGSPCDLLVARGAIVQVVERRNLNGPELLDQLLRIPPCGFDGLVSLRLKAGDARGGLLFQSLVFGCEIVPRPASLARNAPGVAPDFERSVALRFCSRTRAALLRKLCLELVDALAEPRLGFLGRGVTRSQRRRPRVRQRDGQGRKVCLLVRETFLLRDGSVGSLGEVLEASKHRALDVQLLARPLPPRITPRCQR